MDDYLYAQNVYCRREVYPQCHLKASSGVDLAWMPTTQAQCQWQWPTFPGVPGSDESSENQLLVADQHKGEIEKPKVTYVELIEDALVHKGDLTVKEIYSYISRNYAFYGNIDGARWQKKLKLAEYWNVEKVRKCTKKSSKNGCTPKNHENGEVKERSLCDPIVIVNNSTQQCTQIIPGLLLPNRELSSSSCSKLQGALQGFDGCCHPVDISGCTSSGDSLNFHKTDKNESMESIHLKHFPTVTPSTELPEFIPQGFAYTTLRPSNFCSVLNHSTVDPFPPNVTILPGPFYSHVCAVPEFAPGNYGVPCVSLNSPEDARHPQSFSYQDPIVSKVERLHHENRVISQSHTDVTGGLTVSDQSDFVDSHNNQENSDADVVSNNTPPIQHICPASLDANRNRSYWSLMHLDSNVIDKNLPNVIKEAPGRLQTPCSSIVDGSMCDPSNDSRSSFQVDDLNSAFGGLMSINEKDIEDAYNVNGYLHELMTDSQEGSLSTCERNDCNEETSDPESDLFGPSEEIAEIIGQAENDFGNENIFATHLLRAIFPKTPMDEHSVEAIFKNEVDQTSEQMYSPISDSKSEVLNASTGTLPTSANYENAPRAELKDTLTTLQDISETRLANLDNSVNHCITLLQNPRSDTEMERLLDDFSPLDFKPCQLPKASNTHSALNKHDSSFGVKTNNQGCAEVTREANIGQEESIATEIVRSPVQHTINSVTKTNFKPNDMLVEELAHTGKFPEDLLDINLSATFDYHGHSLSDAATAEASRDDKSEVRMLQKTVCKSAEIAPCVTFDFGGAQHEDKFKPTQGFIPVKAPMHCYNLQVSSMESHHLSETDKFRTYRMESSLAPKPSKPPKIPRLRASTNYTKLGTLVSNGGAITLRKSQSITLKTSGVSAKGVTKDRRSLAASLPSRSMGHPSTLLPSYSTVRTTRTRIQRKSKSYEEVRQAPSERQWSHMRIHPSAITPLMSVSSEDHAAAKTTKVPDHAVDSSNSNIDQWKSEDVSHYLFMMLALQASDKEKIN